MKSDEQSRQLMDFASLKARLQSENADLNRQLEDAESQLNNLQRLKSQLSSQLEEVKRSADDETRVPFILSFITKILVRLPCEA